MSSRWATYRIGEIGSVVTGKTPLTKNPAYSGHDVPFVTPPDFVGNKWIRSTARTISESGALSVKNSIVPARSVLVTCIGSDMGKAALCAARCVTNQQINAVIVKDERFSAEFVYYNLSLRKDEIKGMAGGSAQPILKKSAFSETRIECPDIEQQLAIVDVLRPLDDRIALLRETNATLEAIAQALFKSWFVDFDPVRAKQQGLAPAGMDEATAALFPDNVDEWNRTISRPMAEELIAKGSLLVGDGYRAKNDELGIPGVPFVRGGDLVQGQITPTKDFLANAALKGALGKMAKPGDTAFTSKGTIGRFAYVDGSCGDAIYSPQVCFWRSVTRDAIEPAYLHFWMKSAAFSKQVNAVRGQAAIMDYVSLADQRRMRLDLPPVALQKRFSEVVGVALEKISCNRAAATHLATLRDTLLPRLISGQLRLPEAEAESAEATA